MSHAEREAAAEADEEVLAEFGLTMADWDKMGTGPAPEETLRRNG
jgi:hypothetical protein